MAKLGLLFIAIFCIVQIAIASRIPRDADTPTTPLYDVVKDKVLEGVESAKKGFSNIFNQENADKVWTGLQEYGEKISEFGKEVGKTVQDSVSSKTN